MGILMRDDRLGLADNPGFGVSDLSLGNGSGSFFVFLCCLQQVSLFICHVSVSFLGSANFNVLEVGLNLFLSLLEITLPSTYFNFGIVFLAMRPPFFAVLL